MKMVEMVNLYFTWALAFVPMYLRLQNNALARLQLLMTAMFEFLA